MSGTHYRRKYIRQYKTDNNVCAHCGGTFHYCQLDLHHVDEDDKNESLKGGRKNRKCLSELPNMTVLKEEISKCIILCKNCHALHHHSH